MATGIYGNEIPKQNGAARCVWCGREVWLTKIDSNPSVRTLTDYAARPPAGTRANAGKYGSIVC